MNVITRFPPSPTGHFHIGSARTALFNYLFAAHAGGKMRFRFEDTDRARSKHEFERDILEGMRWLGIPFDESAVTRQSDRTDVYSAYIRRLIDAGRAYEAEPAAGDPHKRVIRFKNPGARIMFDDLIRGNVSFDTSELKDFVIAKGVDEPLYHLAVVVDDHDAGVTHVIRGEDHISNTPRQILILEALGFKRPEYAHIPLILAPDRSKLSKRHGAVSVNEYRAAGFIPEAMLNYLALLGWNPGGAREIYSLDELITTFDISRVHKGGAIFDKEKLLWFNHEHLKSLTSEEFADRLRAFKTEVPSGVIPLLQERAHTLKDAADIYEREFSFLGSISYEPSLLLQSGRLDRENTSSHLGRLALMLGDIADADFGQATLKESIWPYATEQGRGAVLWPLRVALSGLERSPDPFILLSLLGKRTSLERIAAAREALQKL